MLPGLAKLAQPGGGTVQSCPGQGRVLHVKASPLLTVIVIAVFVFLLINNKGLEVLSLCVTLETLA